MELCYTVYTSVSEGEEGMSQEKVDRYKNYKANKDKILKREKHIRRLEYTAAIVVAVALVGWFGWSIYQKAADPSGKPAVEYTMDTTAVDDYVNGLGQ